MSPARLSAPELAGEVLQDLQADSLGLDGSAQEHQSGESFGANVAGLEDGEHLGRQALHLAGVAPTDVDHREVQGHEGRIEGDTPFQEGRPGPAPKHSKPEPHRNAGKPMGIVKTGARILETETYGLAWTAGAFGFSRSRESSQADCLLH